MTGFYKVFGKKRVEVECLALLGWKNHNTCLFRIEFPYGVANGYEKRFSLALINPLGFHLLFVDKYNGHARFSFGCGLFTIFFDWLDKKSILVNTQNEKICPTNKPY